MRKRLRKSLCVAKCRGALGQRGEDAQQPSQSALITRTVEGQPDLGSSPTCGEDVRERRTSAARQEEEAMRVAEAAATATRAALLLSSHM